MLVPVSNYKFIMPNFDVTLKAYFYQTAVEENETNVVCISPNPVTDRVKITCEDMKSITLCTSDGRIVKMFNSLNMNDVEKEFHYRRVAVWHEYYGHKFRYWFYMKLSKHYEKKHEKKFNSK